MVRMRIALSLTMMTGALLLAPLAGHSACLPDDRLADPPQPQPGGTVVCSGSDPSGFSRAFLDGLSVSVTPGANISGVILSDASGLSISVAAGANVTSFGTSGVVLSALTLSEVVGGSISNAGQVSTTVVDRSAIFASGTNLTIDNSGVIQTTGAEAQGIFIPSVFMATIDNSGRISTSADEASGIEALGSAIFIDNRGTIETSGLESQGIALEGSATASLISVINAGGITTGGVDAQGIFVEAGEATVANDGSVTTTGRAAAGVIVDGAEAVIENRAQVTTAGDLAPGLGALQGGGTLTNSGTIRTAGSDAAGMQVGLAFLGHQVMPSDANTLLNTGAIDAAGENAHGLYAIGTSNTLTNGTLGNVLASGSGSSGIQVGVSTPGRTVDANGNSLRNRGTITSAGTNGHGLYAAGSNNSLTNEGTIRVDGIDGDGLGAFGRSNGLTNESSGEIQVRSGAGAKGMRYDGDGGFAFNFGFIDVAADDADGISMTGNLLAASNSGRIDVTGGGSGILMRGDQARANNTETGMITTTAASSAGIWMLEGGRIENFGEVQTFGNDASGLVVSGTGGRLARVDNIGSVSTIGSRAYGIEIGRDAPATSGRVNLTGSITTEGIEADGIHISAEVYDVKIGATGGIFTSGAGADGVALNGSGNTLTHEGEIVVQGAGAAGVRLGTTARRSSSRERSRATFALRGATTCCRSRKEASSPALRAVAAEASMNSRWRPSRSTPWSAHNSSTSRPSARPAAGCSVCRETCPSSSLWWSKGSWRSSRAARCRPPWACRSPPVPH